MPIWELSEGESAVYQAQLKDENGDIVSSVESLKITLYSIDDPTFPIINFRNNQDINGANGGLIASGVLTLQLGAADNVILDQKRNREIHRMLLQWVWAGGLKQGNHEVTIVVINRTKIT